MKKHIKITVLAIVLGAGFSLTVFAGGRSEANLADIQHEVTKLSEEMALSLPFSSTFGLNWSDAYIGESRFGVGVAMGFSTISFGA
ncbi:MAG: YdgA family protein, partial [Treponema sp.]|nr:YdgA family protein [Treponema sp.]